MIACEFETANKVVRTRNSSKDAESGGFVLWQMKPDMWYVELALGGSKVHAGCNGKLVWRHTPWLGAHAAKGPVRPLRRALQVTYQLTLDYQFGFLIEDSFTNFIICRDLIQKLQQACLLMQDALGRKVLMAKIVLFSSSVQILQR